MKYLLDTHIFLWYIEDNAELGKNIIDEFENYSNQMYLSFASLYEISIKTKEKKLQIPISFEMLVNETIRNYNIRIVPFLPKHAIEHYKIIPHSSHRDPFDHIIIAQSIAEKFTLISADGKFPFYRSQGLNLLENE